MNIEIGTILTAICITLMFLCFFLYEKPRFLKAIKNNPYIELTSANLASSIGVWFTFAGICFGLYQFDTGNIESSVPQLLNGMKIAFATSILGMAFSIYFKYTQEDIRQHESKTKVASRDAKISDLIEYLQERDEKIYSFQRDLRDEIKSSNDLLINEFRTFTKNMAENNTKAFIEALNETIRDFNNKIQEQFGENFKQLNNAVGKLLIWQENYKDTIEKTNQNQLLIYKTLDNAANSLAAIEKSASSLTNAADGLKNLIVTSAVYSKRLNDEIKTLQDVANEAQNIAPSIQSLVTITINELKNYSEQQQEEISKTITSIKRLFESATNDSKALTTSLNISIKTINRDIESISQTVTATSHQQQEAIRQATEKLSSSSLEITKRISAELERMMKINNENLSTSSKNLADNLDKTLNDSLKLFAKYLIQISEKFAQDYLQLEEQLKGLIVLTENIKTGARR